MTKGSNRRMYAVREVRSAAFVADLTAICRFRMPINPELVEALVGRDETLDG